MGEPLRGRPSSLFLRASLSFLSSPPRSILLRELLQPQSLRLGIVRRTLEVKFPIRRPSSLFLRASLGFLSSPPSLGFLSSPPRST